MTVFYYSPNVDYYMGDTLKEDYLKTLKPQEVVTHVFTANAPLSKLSSNFQNTKQNKEIEMY